MLYPIASPLELKLKYEIHTITTGYPPLDRITPTLHCYKKTILILVTLSITQLRLHFTSSLAKAPCHRSSTYCRLSLSPLSHAHRPSTQRHPQ
jgi:hypothetical protein